MKLFMFVIVFCLVAWLGSASPIDAERELINRMRIFRRSPQKSGSMYVKGKGLESRDYNPTSPPFLRKEHMRLNVRKGEYVCGNRVCKLQPGQIPRGCNGMCQYRV